MNDHPRLFGFAYAPVTKALMTLTIVATVGRMNLAHLNNGVIGMILDRIWFRRLLEMFSGGVLLYNFRQFERFMGSRNFGLYVAISLISSEVFLRTLQLASASKDLKFAPGPYPIIFALLVLFHFEVPVLTRPKVFGYDFLTDKSVFYAVAAQLLVQGGFAALWPAGVGLFTGLLLTSRNIGGFASS